MKYLLLPILALCLNFGLSSSIFAEDAHCPPDCKKECCVKKDGAKEGEKAHKCPADCKKECCVKKDGAKEGEKKKCADGCKKACCAKKDGDKEHKHAEGDKEKKADGKKEEKHDHDHAGHDH